MQSSKVPQLKSFLFCFSLVGGSKFIGYTKATVQLLSVITLFILFTVRIKDQPFPDPRAPFVVYLCGLAIIEAYFAVILLHGIIKRKPAYVKTWVVIQFSILVQNLATFFIIIIQQIIDTAVHEFFFEFRHIAIVGATIGVDIYCILVVYSYYRDEYYRDRSGNIINNDLFDTLE